MSLAKKRVFLCGLHQESNAFNPIPSTKADFGVLEGEQIKAHANDNSITGGLVSRLERDDDVEVVYSTVMSAYSGAPLARSVTEDFTSSVVSALKKAEKLDGVAINFHGATVSEISDDVCGDILEAIRRGVGEDIPISVAFDFHANITEKIMKNADYVCGYLEYPHIDQAKTGERAAELLIAHMNGRKAKTARVTVPMIAPAHAYTTKEGELLLLVNKAKEMVRSGRILDYSLFEVQPWLDVKEMASAVVVIAEDEDVAKAAAKELATMNFEIRKALLGAPLMSVEDVIKKALANQTGKPVVLVDSADSRGAGSTADSAAVIEALLPYKDTLRCAVGVSDAPAVKKAFEVGVGGIADFTLGATVAPALSSPVKIENATVRSLHNGYFFLVNPIGKGSLRCCGRVAVLVVGKLFIQVSEHSSTEGDIGFFRGFGIDPEVCDLVSVKACTSFRAGYEHIAAEICNAATPGAAGTSLTDLPYRKRPVPLYPFEEISEKDISDAVIFR